MRVESGRAKKMDKFSLSERDMSIAIKKATLKVAFLSKTVMNFIQPIDLITPLDYGSNNQRHLMRL